MSIRYVSTRGKAAELSFEDVLLAGLAADGGLYVPTSLPTFSQSQLAAIILMIGIGGFGRGGEFNRKYANKLMRLRIFAQFIAVLLILLFVYFAG